MRRRNYFYKTLISILIFSMLVWGYGAPFNFQFINHAHASSGVTPDYLSDMEGMDIMMVSTSSLYAIGEFDIYDTMGGTLNYLTITIQDVPENTGFDPAEDLAALSSTATTSGMSLWKDNGDSQFNIASDTPATSLSSSWTASGTTWQAMFSGINWSVPTNLKVFIVFKAAHVSSTTPKGFETIVETGDMVFSDGSIGTWPDSYNHFFPPVWIGEAGAGGYGTPFVISEIQTAGAATSDEFVEIYNRSPENMDLSGWSLKYSPSSDTSSLIWGTTLFDFSTSSSYQVQGGGFYLAGHGGLSTTTDATMATSSLNEAGGYVGLFNPMNEVMDWVGYGSLDDETLAEGGQAADAPSASSSIERKAFHDSTYSMMITGGIDADMGNGQDSNNNAMDFIMRPTSDPQNSNSGTEIPQGGTSGGGSDIIINEVYYKTNSYDGWVELFNRTSDNKSLNNFKLKHKNWEYTFPNIEMTGNSYMVVHWNQSGSDTGTDLYTESLGSYLDIYGGDLLLLNETSDIMDYIEYGGSGYANESAAISDAQWMSGDYIPHCLTGESIGRKSTDGEDWNDSYDWQTFTSPSPGSPNMGGDSTAPTAVTNVVLTDNDNSTSSGLDGRDITVSWAPATVPDQSFDRYEIYLLPQGTQLDFSIHSPIDSIYGGQYQYEDGSASSSYAYTGGTFITKDSAGTFLSNGYYKAYVLAFDYYDNKSGTAQSAAANLNEETYAAGDDNMHPFIMHMGVWSAYAGSAMHLLARVDDDRLISSTTPLQAAWKAGTDFNFNLSSGASTTDCIYIQSGFYDCVINWDAGWDTSYVIGYYLKALDDAGNYAYMSASPDADMSYNESNVQLSPFYIDIMTAPSDAGTVSDLSGTTYSWNGSTLASSTVFLEGMALPPITTSASGTFAFADDSIDTGMYHVTAFRDGYMDMVNNVYKGDYVSFYLNEGDVNMSGGGGDGGANPIIIWTAPFDNMMGAPIDIFCTGDCSTIGNYEEPVIVAFDRPMNGSTINDQNAADSGSNIYLTSDGNDRISGKVYYDSTAQEARFFASAHDTLALGTYYSIVVTQGVTDELGNPIMGANSDGSFSNGFATIMSTTTDFDDFGTGGATMPPYVMGVIPAPGSFNVYRNTSVIIEFSEPMDSSSINGSNIKLIPITNSSTWTEGDAVSAVVSLDQTTRRIATINPDADLNATSTWWVIKVLGNVRSSTGMFMANPDSVGGCSDWNVCDELNAITAFQSNFQINTGAIDTTAPSVVGTYPNNNDGITSSTTAVYVGIGALEIGFSEAMDPNTINAENIKLLAGTSVTGGNVNYDPMSNNAKFMPSSAFLANTQYTLRITANCTDLAGNQLNATTSKYFKTGAADTVPPELMYANGDDYSIAVTFNEPMNTAKQTDASNWQYSVLNPANYAVNGLVMADDCKAWSCSVSEIPPYNGATGTPLSGLGLSFSYEDYNNTVIIKGFQFASSTTDFQIFIDNVRDKSNNTIADSGNRVGDNSHLNAARAPLYSSTDTYGALGPGAIDYTMDMGDMGMMMAGAFPMNAIAGQQSLYFIDIPTTKSIPIGGKIIITFPAGFDVSQAVKDPYSPVNNDINEWNTGIVTIHSVTGDQSARTVTIIATTSATQLNDYLHMDIKGIVNSNLPKDFGTEGYTVDIKTFTADGALLETIYTMPFFITEGGANSISGEIHGVAGGDNGIMGVYLGSPMTGPMESEVVITGTGDAGADGVYSFNNLPDGEYFIFTEPTITINGNDYFGNPHPEPIWLNGASSTKNIVLSPETSGGAPVTVSLTGNFSTDGAADDVDIFAGSPGAFRVKTLSGLGNVTNATTTLYLSAGDWMIGIGPAMPESSMSGPPPMPDWMPPANVYYHSDGSTPGNISFSIAGQSIYTISGTVVDGSGSGLADTEVYAYQPMGGYGGANTKTATDGTFTLKIPVLGTYLVGAYKPGLPNPKDQAVEVTGNASGLIIKITKPAFTISGKVLNSSGNAIAYAPVWAWQENSWGHADTMSDASGNYILYVNAGTWHVEADAPGIGWMEYDLLLTIVDTSKISINISPSASTQYYSISGKVGISTTSPIWEVDLPFANMPIRAVEYNATTGAYQGKEFNSMTNSNGEYTISVPAGAYRVDIWTQEYGELGVNDQDNDATLGEANEDDKYPTTPANVNATGGNVANADIIVVQSGLRDIGVTVTNAPSGQEGFLNIEGVSFSGAYPEPTGFHLSRRIDDLSATTTIKLADGDYFFFLDIPGYGSYIPDASDRHPVKDDIEITSATSVNFTLPDMSSGMVTVSGTIYAGSEFLGNELGDAWVWIGNPSNGYHNGTVSASSGVYSLIVPASSGYKIGADKPGYMSNQPSSLSAIASSTGNNIVLTQYGLAISGHIYSDANSSNTYNDGEGVPNGFVRAETTQCGDSDTSNDASCQRSHSPVDGTGAYELGVVAGVWKVYGMADGYSETEFGINITITTASTSDKNIKLTVNANWTTKSKQKPITPASGGSLDDTDPNGTGVKLTIPPNALGSSNSSGNVNAQKTSAVTKTNSSDPVGGEGVTVTATDNSGQAINSLDDYIDIEMVIYKSEVDAAIASNTLTYAKLKNTKNGYWDSTTNDWVNLATTRNAYYKRYSTSTDWTLYANSATTSPAFEAFINEVAGGTISLYDYKLVFTSKTNHLTIFAIIMPFIASAAEEPPSDPDPDPDPDPPAPGGGGPTISYCTSVEYGDWGSCLDGSESREVVSKTPSGCRLTSVQEIDKSRVCLESEVGEAIEEETEEIITTAENSLIDALFLEQGQLLERAEVTEMLAMVNRERKHEEEYLARDILVNRLKINLGELEPRHQYALTNYIAYGSPDTLKLGSGERAGVLNSFRSAFNKLPFDDNDWSDIIKIANGRWPAQRSAAAEENAELAFEKIYLKIADRSDPNDDAAVTVIAYGLRPAARNIDSEAAAIRIFKAIFNYNPSSATDWDIVRAIAYSGAVREADIDKDLLVDRREDLIGTDPDNPDTDGDGYSDGFEVKKGHDPLVK